MLLISKILKLSLSIFFILLIILLLIIIVKGNLLLELSRLKLIEILYHLLSFIFIIYNDFSLLFL